MRSGARIDIRNPRLDLIRATDIAESLAKLPMYRGATWGFYSVAQHSTLVATEVSREEGPLAGLYALLHQADDAFGCLATAEFSAILHGAFDLDWPCPRDTARAFAYVHSCVEMTELRQLCTGREDEVAAHEKLEARPLRGMIKPLAWDRAMDRYIEALKVYAVAAQLHRIPALGDEL
ncbi:MAG TPA: hypothetical protein VGM17_02460 [Rhizomicrobium sp.]|jgi:hypothetical protein